MIGNLSIGKDIIKKSLLQLDSSIFSTQLCLGCVVSPILFAGGKRALMINKERECAIVFSRSQEEADYSIMLLTQLIAIINEIKKQGLLLGVGYKKTDLEFFYSSSQNELIAQSVPGRYCSSTGCILECLDTPLLKDEDIILKGYSLPPQLFEPLSEALLSVFFPTPDYKVYLTRDFCTVEEYRAKRALRVSWVAIIVAILIGISSPFFAVFWGNRYGQTELKVEQYQGLLKEIRNND